MNVRDLVPWSRGDRERSPATRSDSFSPVASLHREMNRLFDDGVPGGGMGGHVAPVIVAGQSPSRYWTGVARHWQRSLATRIPGQGHAGAIIYLTGSCVGGLALVFGTITVRTPSW